jgi:hypothetical protein
MAVVDTMVLAPLCFASCSRYLLLVIKLPLSTWRAPMVIHTFCYVEMILTFSGHTMFMCMKIDHCVNGKHMEVVVTG